MNLVSRIIAVSSLAMLASCTHAQQRTSLAQIEALIGAAACTRDDQCRVVGIGARSCGGPESYRAWSTLTTDERALIAAADRFAAEQTRINDKLGLMSTCVILPEPTVACVRKQGETRLSCEVASGGPGQRGIR